MTFDTHTKEAASFATSAIAYADVKNFKQAKIMARFARNHASATNHPHAKFCADVATTRANDE